MCEEYRQILNDSDVIQKLFVRVWVYPLRINKSFIDKLVFFQVSNLICQIKATRFASSAEERLAKDIYRDCKIRITK